MIDFDFRTYEVHGKDNHKNKHYRVRFEGARDNIIKITLLDEKSFRVLKSKEVNIIDLLFGSKLEHKIDKIMENLKIDI